MFLLSKKRAVPKNGVKLGGQGQVENRQNRQNSHSIDHEKRKQVKKEDDVQKLALLVRFFLTGFLKERKKKRTQKIQKAKKDGHERFLSFLFFSSESRHGN